MVVITLLNIETNIWAFCPPDYSVYMIFKNQILKTRLTIKGKGSILEPLFPLPAWVFAIDLSRWDYCHMGKEGTRNLICPKYVITLRGKIILCPQAVLTLPEALMSRPVLGSSLFIICVILHGWAMLKAYMTQFIVSWGPGFTIWPVV